MATDTLEDLAAALDENPAGREAVRVRLLTRELLELPQIIDDPPCECHLNDSFWASPDVPDIPTCLDLYRGEEDGPPLTLDRPTRATTSEEGHDARVVVRPYRTRPGDPSGTQPAIEIERPQRGPRRA